MTRVPSRSRVSSPATSPRDTHGSAIGSQARSTCGIWIRWSISASPAKPASSAASAIDRSQPAGSSPQGNRASCRITASPCDERRSADASTDASGGASGAVGRSGVTTWTRSHPSSSTSARASLKRRSCWVSAVAGTTYARSALRRRVSSGGVSMTTATAGRPASRAACSQARAAAGVEARGCRPRWSAVGTGGRRRCARGGRRPRRSHRGRAPRCRPPSAARRRRRSRGAGSGRPRNATCPTPRVRRGPRVRDRASSTRREPWLAVWQPVSWRRSCRGRGWRGPSRAGPGRGG